MANLFFRRSYVLCFIVCHYWAVLSLCAQTPQERHVALIRLLAVPSPLPQSIAGPLKLGAFFAQNKDTPNALRFTQMALANAQAANHPSGQIKAWLQLAPLYESQRLFEKSCEAYENALPLLEQQQDVVELGRTGYRLSRLFFFLRALERSNHWGTYALRYKKFMADYDPRRLFHTYFLLGQNFEMLYQLDSCLYYLKGAVQVGESRQVLELGDALFIIASLNNEMGHYYEAMTFAQKAVACAQKAQDTSTEIIASIVLANIHLQLHDHASTKAIYQQAILKGGSEQFRNERLKARFGLIVANSDTLHPADLAMQLKPILDSLVLRDISDAGGYFGQLANIQQKAGQYKAALESYTAGIKNARTFENTPHLVSNLLSKAECLNRLGRYKEAYPLLLEVYAYFQKWQNPRDYARCLHALGLCEANLGKLPLANNYLSAAWALEVNSGKQKTDAVAQITNQLAMAQNKARLLQTENEMLALESRSDRTLTLAVIAMLISILIVIYIQYKRRQLEQQTALHYQEIAAQLTALAPEHHQTIPYGYNANAVIKVAQEVVKKFKEDSSRQTEELRAFNYTVSHDLKAPLANAEHFTDLLELRLAQYQDQYALENLTHFRELIAEMKQMIDGISAYARADTIELAMAPVETPILLNSVVRQLAPLYPHALQRIQIEPVPDIQGDPLLLRQIFSNLLENALKFTQYMPQPLIKVSGWATQKVVHIEITDNGAGFMPPAAERIFDLFHSAHERQRFKGSGIGLAIVRRIVERHGGKVWAHSDGVDKGAVFSVELPVKVIKN